MCSHPEHEFERRPGGIVAETHILTDADMEAITERALDLLLRGHLFVSTAEAD